MVKRIVDIKELRSILVVMERGDMLQRVLKKQRHVAGDWNLDHLKDQIYQTLLSFKENAVIFVYFHKDKPVSIFVGIVTQDWACGKMGLNEVIWVSVGKSSVGGFKVIEAVEQHIVAKGIDFLSCQYMSNGGDPRIQMFYMNNGFNLDTLTFVKRYK